MLPASKKKARKPEYGTDRRKKEGCSLCIPDDDSMIQEALVEVVVAMKGAGDGGFA